MDGAKRELSEEVIFDGDDKRSPTEALPFELAWCTQPYSTADSITEGFHYLIAVCFAEVVWNEEGAEQQKPWPLPAVTASDDAVDARWWSVDEFAKLDDQKLLGTKNFVKRLERTEFLYQNGVLQSQME